MFLNMIDFPYCLVCNTTLPASKSHVRVPSLAEWPLKTANQLKQGYHSHPTVDLTRHMIPVERSLTKQDNRPMPQLCSRRLLH